MLTRSQTKKLAEMELNSKGHPTVGMLRPKPVPRPRVNYYLAKCVTLETTADALKMGVYLSEHGRHNTDYERWIREIYAKLYDFVNRDMKPTFDEIDAMLLVCRILMSREMKHELAEFILNCPAKFLITYVNNSETNEYIFRQLSSMGLDSVCSYLLQYVHESKLGTWNERRNTHLRGNVLFECSYN